jgi:hypothetical protein
LAAGANNIETAWQLAPHVTGLKMYLDQTFGPLWLDVLDTLMRHMERWPADRPVRCHARGRTGFPGRLPVPGIQKRATGKNRLRVSDYSAAQVWL